MRRALGTALVGFAGLAVQACGGATDVPRLEDDRVLAVPPDQCTVGAEYGDVLSIASFELSGCGSPPELLCSFYSNSDTLRTPQDSVGNRGGDCQQQILNGQLVESGVVEAYSTTVGPTERCGASTAALHLTATNLGMCFGTNGRRGWGASYEVDFINGGVKAPIDASAWDGFSFWVRKGAGPSDESIIVLAVDNFAAGMEEATDPETGASVSCAAGDPATQPRAEPDFQKCDPFAIGVTLTDEWQFVPVYFSEMRQKGFGTPAPLGLNTSELLRLQFLVSAGNWDLWIDDISFFRAP